MATFFGKLLGGLGIGRNANPSMGMMSRPTGGVLAPAKSIGILQPSAGNLLTDSQNKSVTFADIVGGAGAVIGVAAQVKDLVTNGSTVNGGVLPEVTVTATKPNIIENLKTAVANVAEGKPAVTMGQEFSVSDNLKLPIYIGLGLLAYKLLKGGR